MIRASSEPTFVSSIFYVADNTCSVPVSCGSACKRSKNSKGSTWTAEKSNVAASIVLQMDGLSVLPGGRVRLGGSVESDPKEHVL
jgi:hypothetical protein